MAEVEGQLTAITPAAEGGASDGRRGCDAEGVADLVMDTACINDRLITVIACPMCLKSMRSTILQCENGHNVCFDCRQSLPACPLCNEYFSGLRNLLAEQIISNLFLEYCENGIRGCRALVPADRVQLHKATCPFRLMFCWICRNDVAFNKIMIHFHRKHPDNVIKNGMSRVVKKHEVKSPFSYTFQIEKKDQVFWFWRRNQGRVVYFGVQYVGGGTVNQNCIYRLEILSPDREMYLKYRAPVHMTSDNPQDSSSPTKCGIISADLLEEGARFRIVIV